MLPHHRAAPIYSLSFSNKSTLRELDSFDLAETNHPGQKQPSSAKIPAICFLFVT